MKVVGVAFNVVVVLFVCGLPVGCLGVWLCLVVWFVYLWVCLLC